jgi:hypothetical protein
MSDKLSVQLWGMSANAEGQMAIGAIIFIVVVVAIVTLVQKRRVIAAESCSASSRFMPCAKGFPFLKMYESAWLSQNSLGYTFFT